MRALKTLVIGMAVLIVAGLTVVVNTVVKRSGNATPAATPVESFGDARVVIPAGSRVEATVVDGGRLVATLVLADGSRRTIVVDLATGRRLGMIRFVPGESGEGSRKP